MPAPISHGGLQFAWDESRVWGESRVALGLIACAVIHCPVLPLPPVWLHHRDISPDIFSAL